MLIVLCSMRVRSCYLVLFPLRNLMSLIERFKKEWNVREWLLCECLLREMEGAKAFFRFFMGSHGT